MNDYFFLFSSIIVIVTLILTQDYFSAGLFYQIIWIRIILVHYFLFKIILLRIILVSDYTIFTIIWVRIILAGLFKIIWVEDY